MRTASAPGRVNLLGEHVDHAGGTVMPVAIHWRTHVDYEPGGDWEIRSDGHPDGGAWTRYVTGVLEALAERGEAPEPGRLALRSRVPAGRGLASSAALEVAVAGVLSDAAPWDLAQLCRRVENEKVGVPCGLMDQACAACAIAGHALVLDCSDETFFHLALPEMDLLLLDSGTGRELARTPYAERAEEARTPGTRAARHVATERARVERGIELLDRGDAVAFGRLLTASHDSLRDDYRCSTPQLDALVERALDVRGVFGARLIGAGWGGCVLAVAEPGVEVEGAVRLLSDDGLVRLA